MSWSRTLKVRQSIRTQLEAGEEIAFLFSDIRGFSAFTAERGDRAAYRLSQLHEGILRERIDEHGVLVKSLGDGIMAAFETPWLAIHSAVEVQGAIRDQNQRSPEEPIDVGIGVASGTPVMTDIDFIGHSVNVAQRLSSLAKGGQILATERIRRTVSLPEDLKYIPLGARPLKGIGTEGVVEVAWLKEVARISDAQDQVTLILTQQETLVVELAKDTKQRLRDGLEELRAARASESGVLSAFLQRAIGRFTQRLVGPSLRMFGIAREQGVDQLDWRYHRGALEVETPDGSIVLEGVDRDRAKHFIAEAEVLREKRRTQPPNGDQGLLRDGDRL